MKRSLLRVGWVLGALACSCTQANTPAPATVETAPVPEGGGNLLQQETFDDGASLPWMTSFSAPADGEAEVKQGAYCVKVNNPGTNKWDAQVRHREMVIEKGHQYTVDFIAWASRDTRIRPKVGQAGPPYVEWWAPEFIDISTKPQRFVDTFVMQGDDDPTAEFAFHMGGRLQKGDGPIEICFDDIRLADPRYAPHEHKGPTDLPAIRANQTGYLPGLSKIAIWVSETEEPAEWELQDSSGKVLASGKTEPFGLDPYAGERVHRIDFSAFKEPAKDVFLVVGDAKSNPFDVGPHVYSQLKYDALAYFYHNRSGIPIEMPYAGQEKWTRPAGHKPDVMHCASNAGCDYDLDVTGGWYDAGDQGKYVVNGGISVWTLQNEYEYFAALGNGADYGDGKLNIPERKNGKPDLLDEARWEMEFLLKMQVPQGKKLAGMAHHKGHDQSWTALGTPPHEDTMPRVLKAPSTAATLNLAATAAQAARLWKRYDKAFSARCLSAAERAYRAAEENPAIFAPADDSVGGGPYDDTTVDDDFYWAAAELFITTGKPQYKKAIERSPYYKKLHGARGQDSIMTWQWTDGLAAISLATAKYGDEALRAHAKKQLVAAADEYVSGAQAQGYRVPFEPAGGGYPWGSNSFVLNNMIVLALAFDITGQEKYRQAVVDGADYLLGKNALSQSYVTGYGERPLHNPHHRFWSHQANAAFPEAPPGAVSGGPNSSIQDPYARAAGLKGCKPAQCFMDHIESWSTNEITINWNSPLAWVTGWLDQQAH